MGLPDSRRRRAGGVVRLALAAALFCACANAGTGPSIPAPRVQAFLDTLEQRTFSFFWERTDPQTGLSPDRWPTQSFSSIAAVGFALTAYPVGVEKGFVSRAAAADRTLNTLRFFYRLPQGTAASGTGGYQGFFYHFVDPSSGLRFQTVELSTVDTALLLGGVLFCREYFGGTDPVESAIRAYADSLYRRVNWQWARPRPPMIAMGWTPESGFHQLDWRGYNEAMLVYILALGSPTFPIDPAAWQEWTSTYQWGDYRGGQAHVGFAPLFGHQYSHVWIDFRGIRDAYMRGRGIDYFENSRRATYAQRAYAIANPDGWRGYGQHVWGLTASDGPADVTLPYGGRDRRFFTYAARGVSFTEVRDDGTIAPTAAGGSRPFAPEIAGPALVTMRERYGDGLFGQYGFLDAFNPTWQWTSQPLTHGRVLAGLGWFDTDYLGIDQGPILAMIANYRSDLIWKHMRQSPYVIEGLRRAGFQGGWLDSAP
ncbi:MAG TPA: glucoamylase family protein [Gemmatimonadales bacterium]|nr:glucoamylase family protein [Gemmatimonadales bacterium]